MTGRTTLFRASLTYTIAACIAGCAATGGPPPTLTKATVVPEGSAKSGITIGKSTKADVVALLGRTTEISFDSGYEVWVYHLTREAQGRTQQQEKAEFVVLFSPTGVVMKTRIRPPAPS
jgi:hypothetical protein